MGDYMDKREHLKQLIHLLQAEFVTRSEQLNQKEIADRTGLDYSTLNRYINFRLKDSNRVNTYISTIEETFFVKLEMDANEYVLRKLPGFEKIKEDHQSTRYFAYYYVYNFFGKSFKIAKAKLSITRRNNSAEIIFYSQRNGTASETKKGEVYEVGGQLLVTFSYSKDLLKDSKPSMNYLAGGWKGLDNEIILGTYVAEGPACGMAVAVSYEADKIDEAIQAKTIPHYIVGLLRGKRLEVHSRGIEAITDTKSYGLVKRLEKYQRTYFAYILESRPSRESIHELNLEIFDGNRIRFKSYYTKEHEGYIVDFIGNTIICLIRFRDEAAKRYYRNYMVINLDPDKIPTQETGDQSIESYLGVYAGVEADNKPIGGRIMLIPADQKYQELSPKKFKLSPFKERETLLQAKPFIKSFIRGELDTFIDSAAVMEKHELLGRGANEKTSDYRNEPFPFAGVYFVFRLSGDGKFINKCPVKIHSTGAVTYIGKDKNKNGFNYKGKAYYWNDSYISIILHEREHKPFYVYHAFFVGSSMPQANNFYHGISSSFTNANNLRASREILYITGDERIEHLHFEKIPVHHDASGEIQFETDAHQNFDFLHFLLGTSHSMISSENHINAVPPKKDYGEMYFSTACYHCHRGTKSIKEIFSLLELALAHGFRDQERWQAELESGMLNNDALKAQLQKEELMSS